MQPNADAILSAALQLSEADRFALISQLLEATPESDLTISVDDPNLAAELDRRFADQDGAVSWSELASE